MLHVRAHFGKGWRGASQGPQRLGRRNKDRGLSLNSIPFVSSDFFLSFLKEAENITILFILA
jgi:hypothetical protein